MEIVSRFENMPEDTFLQKLEKARTALLFF